jgi:hypothetical protein
VEGNAPLARTVLTPVETAMEDMYVAISHHILKLWFTDRANSVLAV